MGEAALRVKHGTASVFVFAWLTQAWRIGLIHHPRLGRLMIPGGHIEPGESPEEAALREVAEETGLLTRLVAPPGPPLPMGYQSSLIAHPWWIAEYQVPADDHLAAGHVHVDHLYVAVADDPMPIEEPEHPFGWHAVTGLPGLHMFDDTRTMATALLSGLNDYLFPPGRTTPETTMTAALLAGLAG